MSINESLKVHEPAPSAHALVAKIDHQVWEKLWVESMVRPWSVLTLVPACRSGHAGFAVGPLAEVGRQSLGGGVHGLRAEGIPLAECRGFIESLEARRGAGGRSIVSVDSPQKSQAALLIARAADAAILLVTMETDRLTPASETIDAVGRERFIGSFLVHLGKR